MANNGNPPIDHYRYLNAKHIKPVLLLMLKHADLPDTVTMRLRDNLLNFIDSPQDQRVHHDHPTGSRQRRRGNRKPTRG